MGHKVERGMPVLSEDGGVAIMMVRPSAARCARVSQNSRRETGSTPVVGSSRSRT